MVEEEPIMTPLHKTKKKMMKEKDEVGLNKVLAQEMTLSLVAQNKGGTKASIDSLVKRPFMTLKKNKGKKKVPELNEELMHMDLHSLKESKDVDSLLVIPLNQPGWEKGANGP
jgi:hypothetical protein